MIALDQLSCVADITRYQSKINGHRVAQIFEGRETTYTDLDYKASQVANGLIAAGCEPNTRICYPVPYTHRTLQTNYPGYSTTPPRSCQTTDT